MRKHVNCEGLNVYRNLYFIILQENRLRTISLTLQCRYIFIQLPFVWEKLKNIFMLGNSTFCQNAKMCTFFPSLKVFRCRSKALFEIEYRTVRYLSKVCSSMDIGHLLMCSVPLRRWGGFTYRVTTPEPLPLGAVLPAGGGAGSRLLRHRQRTR